jgi:hypothetical protein
MKPFVNHWRYDDGWHEIPLALRDKNGVMTNDQCFNEDLVGWHCWVYPSNDIDFEAWMKQNMTGFHDCTFRFNSGNPMYTVFITSDEDATLFKLTWM